MIDTQVHIEVEQTPNPNAEKFILDRNVILEGKRTLTEPAQGEAYPLAKALFAIASVTQLHFFQHVISVTQDGKRPWAELERDIIMAIQEHLPAHDPLMKEAHQAEPARPFISEEVNQIEGILDRTIRPGLQGDGGDLEVVDYLPDTKRLLVRYQGACGTCPSSTAGTLMAIQQILSDEMGHPIEVMNV